MKDVTIWKLAKVTGLHISTIKNNVKVLEANLPAIIKCLKKNNELR